MLSQKRLTYLGLWLLAVIIATVLLRTSVINIAWVSSGSMLPEHEINSRLLSNQLAWGLNLPFLSRQPIQWRLPQRGDIVLFHNPHDDNNIWMKRVIGLPGDKIAYKNRQLTVNGISCNSDKRNRERLPLSPNTFTLEYKVWRSYLEKEWGPVTVPEGKLFLMGDHRGASIDSRSWGTIPVTYLVGEPFARIWPLSRFQWLP